jgi:hypothetical protein
MPPRVLEAACICKKELQPNGKKGYSMTEVSPGHNGKGKSEGSELKPDLDVAVKFLEQLHPGAKWQTLTRIHPDTGAIATNSYGKAEEWRTYIAAHNDDQGTYYNPNRTRFSMHKKAKKEDIAEIHFIHTDLDPK